MCVLFVYSREKLLNSLSNLIKTFYFRTLFNLNINESQLKKIKGKMDKMAKNYADPYYRKKIVKENLLIYKRLIEIYTNNKGIKERKEADAKMEQYRKIQESKRNRYYS